MHLSISAWSSSSFELPDDPATDLSLAACFSASFFVFSRLSSSFRSSVRLRSIDCVCSASNARYYKGQTNIISYLHN